MESITIKFTANGQTLTGGGLYCASNTVRYIIAEFDLGDNWQGYDSVRAVWSTDFKCISTVLDPSGSCTVPHEVLERRGKVSVNLVGSVLEDDELTDRLTTYPVLAITVDANAKVCGTETAEVTPSQFEQYVAIVIAEVEKVTGMTAVAYALPEGSAPTANYSDGVLTLGIPKGDTGAAGNGISRVEFNEDYSLTFYFTDSEPFTTPSIRGAQGARGYGIASVEKIDSTGLVDTYRITFEDPSVQPTTFTVTNGEEGPQGPRGYTGETGNGIESVYLTATHGAVKTYTILFTDGTTTTFDVTDGEVTNAQLTAAVTDLKEEISDVKTDVDNLSQSDAGYDENNNLVDGLLLTRGYYANGGTFVNNANYSHLIVDVSQTAKVHIDGNLHIYTSTEFSALGIFCDANGDYLTSILAITGVSPSFPIEIEVPNNAKSLKLNTDYKASDYPSSLPSGLVCYPWKDNLNTKKLKFIAGVIRNSGNGWEYINDAGHEPLNLNAISVDSSGRIVIEYSFTASKVLSLVATPDETFARRYNIGGSVGLDKALFNVYSTPISYGGQISVSNNAVNVTYSTFTSGSFNTSTGELKLFHPTLDSLNAKEKFNVSATCKSVSYDVRLGSQGTDYVSLFIINSSGSVVKDTTDLTITLTSTRQVNSVFVDANNIVDAGGNFWIYGVMEI